MSADVRPAGLDTFIRCGTPGCDVMVYAPRGSQPHCRNHGSASLYEYRQSDEWGNPRSDGRVLPPAARAPSEVV